MVNLAYRWLILKVIIDFFRKYMGAAIFFVILFIGVFRISHVIDFCSINNKKFNQKFI